MGNNFYNENDPYAAQWLRNLVAAGHIAPGTVSAKSILDLEGRELAGVRQAHFFAGIGVWSAALRAAGWPDSRRVWTGSCPCQPFSGAGKGAGFVDERHLWPAWFWLIEQHRPDVIFGEQVEGPAGRAWLDLVFDDLEGIGYSCGATVSPAAGVGAPHPRHRLFFVAHSDGASGGLADAGRECREYLGHDVGTATGGNESQIQQRQRLRPDDRPSGAAGGLADAQDSDRWRVFSIDRDNERDRQDGGRAQTYGTFGGRGEIYGVAGRGARPGPVNGIWRLADWIFCRDGKWRPVEPGTQPLAHGARSRVGRLRAYGNAICLPQAQAFIEAFLEVKGLSL